MAQVVEAVPFDPESLCTELSQRGHAWADADAAYRTLDDASKTVLAQAYIDIKDAQTVGEREARARITLDYVNHLAALGRARKAANIAEVNYKTYDKYVNLCQTRESTRRAEASIR